MKKESGLTRNQKASIGLALTLLPLMWGCTSLGLGDHYKHTGPMKYVGHAEFSDSYQFERPSGVIFVARFDADQRPRLNTGDVFSDVTYYDKGEFRRVFVSATYTKHAPTSVKSEQYSGGEVVFGNGVTLSCVGGK